MLTDRTTTIRASVEDVQFELMLSVGLVVLVIFVFLRTAAGTVIPSVAVPLSLVGTFGVMYLLGFSLNNLTLMALTIATGFVVDDAIVMIENIARYIEAGERPLAAALKGAEQIGFTILSLTVSLVAVLIPLLFMGDVVGRLFREFAITLGITILISAVVSLTLTPMMCATLLRHTPPERQGRFYRWSERMFERIIEGYGTSLRWVLGHQPATLLVAAATLVLTIALYVVVPKGFFPVQDTGVILGISEAPQSISFPAMAERQQALARVILKDPAVASLSSFIGVDGTNVTLNSGRILINLKPLDERGLSASDVIRRLQPRLAEVGRHHALHAAGAGPHRRGPRQPHAVPVQPRGRGRRRAERVGAEARRGAPHAAGAARREQRPAGSGARHRAGHRPRDRLAPRRHARRPSTTRSTTPSASARSPPCSRSSTSTASCSRCSRTSAATPPGCATSTCAAPAAASRSPCRSAR